MHVGYGLLPVLTDSFWHTQTPQPLYSSKTIKATVLDSSKRQRLTHVGAAKVVDAGHPSLDATSGALVSDTVYHTVCWKCANCLSP